MVREKLNVFDAREMEGVQNVKEKALLNAEGVKGRANALAVMDEVILDVKTAKGKGKSYHKSF